MKCGNASLVVAGMLLCGLAAVPALGVPTFFILQRDTRFNQTGPSTTPADGFLFQGRASPNDGIGPIDFDGGTISFPASSPIATSPLGPSGAELSYSSGKILDQATFQTDYPFAGTYTFHLTDSANAAHTQTEAVDDSIGTAVATVPALTAASFNGLQGMDASHAFTVNFNSFADPGPGALIFFAVQDALLGNTVLFDGLQPNVMQDVISAGKLQPGTQYNFFLFFENNAISADNIAQVTLDTRTKGSFTTQAVPEPAAGLLAAAALGSLLRLRRRPCGR